MTWQSEITKQDIEDAARAGGYTASLRTVTNSMAYLDSEGAFMCSTENWRPWENKAQMWDLMADAGVHPIYGVHGVTAQQGEVLGYCKKVGVSEPEATIKAVWLCAVAVGRNMREGG